MRNFLKKISWLCYGITLLIFAAALYWALLPPDPCPHDPFFEYVEIFLHFVSAFYFAIPLTALISGYRLGRKGTCLAWVYPIFVAILSRVALVIYVNPQEAHWGYFNGWVYFFGMFLIPFIGLVFGRIASDKAIRASRD